MILLFKILYVVAIMATLLFFFVKRLKRYVDFKKKDIFYYTTEEELEILREFKVKGVWKNRLNRFYRISGML